MLYYTILYYAMLYYTMLYYTMPMLYYPGALDSGMHTFPETDVGFAVVYHITYTFGCGI